MTRLNLVPPGELSDQHLFAEYREIKMVPMSLRRSLYSRGIEGVLKMIPPAYTLGKGHVSFFYDKYVYLHGRYEALRKELNLRGIKYNLDTELDKFGVYKVDRVVGDLVDRRFHKGYTPTFEALVEVRVRIAERVAMKPEWYRWSGAHHEHTQECSCGE